MSTSSHETAKRVLDAVDQSGAHYGSGFPMIASENVISPMVRRACRVYHQGLGIPHVGQMRENTQAFDKGASCVAPPFYFEAEYCTAALGQHSLC